MSEPVPHRSDESPGQAASPSSDAAERADTLPLNSVTKRNDAAEESTVPPPRRASARADRAMDATQIDASVADPSFTPTMAVPTGIDQTGVDQTLDFVSKQVQRKAAAVLRTHVGDYEIERELGRGGMGVVYKARHRQLRRDVALKMILSGKHAGAEQLERFLTEARSVAQLQHPNIVQIFDIGEHDGLPYFSLEFVDGQSLSQYVNRQPQSPQEAARMVETLAVTMQYAHDHGVLHRDLKPANVLLTQDGTPKISDFGLAKKVDDEDSASTRTGTVMGTPSYMPPEQAKGLTHDVGPASDQYSLGAMLYEMLTGRPPFLASKPVETILQVIHDEPVRPRQMQPSTPVDIETICLKALQKDVDKRYASCLDFASDLRRFLNGEPILARPVPGYQRAWRWCRRNPRLATSLAAATAMTLAFAVVSTWSAMTFRAQNLVIKKERDNVESQRKVAAESARIATNQRGLAMETLYKVVTKVDQKLKDRADMHELRQELIKDAMDGLERVEESDDTKSLIDRSMGVGHQRMADILQQIGQTDDAAKQHEQALAIFEKLMAADPHDDWAKWDAALSCDHLGTYYRSAHGDLPRTRELYTKALRLREELQAGLHVDDPELTPAKVDQALVNSYAKLGMLAMATGDSNTARDYFMKTLKRSEGLVAADGKNVAARQALAGSYLILGGLNARLNDADAAIDFFDKALVLRRALVSETPQSMKANLDLVRALHSRGDIELQQRGRPAAAIPSYDESLRTSRVLYGRDAKDADVRSQLAGSYHRMGTAHVLLGQSAQADEHFREALVVRRALATEDAANASKQIELMHSLARAGEHAEAFQLGQSLLPRVGKDPRNVFNLTCGFALCAETMGKQSAESDGETLSRQYADVALQTLQKAIQLGYNDRQALTTDPDLTFVRASPAFAAIAASIKK